MHLGMPECHKPFLGHCDLDLWPSFQDLLCPEHISYIIWCRNPKFGVVIPLGMVEWCIPFWVTLTLTLTSGLISSFSCYITAIFPQMCLMLDQFLWGHSSRVCDISCSAQNCVKVSPGFTAVFQITSTNWSVNPIAENFPVFSSVGQGNLGNYSKRRRNFDTVLCRKIWGGFCT